MVLVEPSTRAVRPRRPRSPQPRCAPRRPTVRRARRRRRSRFDPATASYVVDARRATAQGVDVDARPGRSHDALRRRRGHASRSHASSRARSAREGTTAVADCDRREPQRHARHGGLLHRRPSAPCPSTARRSASWLTVDAGASAARSTSAPTRAPSRRSSTAFPPRSIGRRSTRRRSSTRPARCCSTPTAGVVGRALDDHRRHRERPSPPSSPPATPSTRCPSRRCRSPRRASRACSRSTSASSACTSRRTAPSSTPGSISSGTTSHATTPGHFTINSKATVQTMNGSDRDAQATSRGTYSTPNVPWPMYFNGDQAFHGVYWHNNFGNQMSHGCVSMPESARAQLALRLVRRTAPTSGSTTDAYSVLGCPASI